MHREGGLLDRSEVGGFIELEGEARGASLLTDAMYVSQEGGETVLREVERELRRLGCPLDYAAIREMEWYPLGWRLLSLLCIADLLGLDDAGVRAMADAAPKRSFIVRLMMRFFISPARYFGRFPAIWQKYYSVGSMEVAEVDEASGYAVVCLLDFNHHPIQCRYLEGFLRRAARLCLPHTEVLVEETRCAFGGDPFHEYRISWRE